MEHGTSYDLAKAFDTVPFRAGGFGWILLQRAGCPLPIIDVMKDLYSRINRRFKVLSTSENLSQQKTRKDVSRAVPCQCSFVMCSPWPGFNCKIEERQSATPASKPYVIFPSTCERRRTVNLLSLLLKHRVLMSTPVDMLTICISFPVLCCRFFVACAYSSLVGGSWNEVERQKISSI